MGKASKQAKDRKAIPGRPFNPYAGSDRFWKSKGTADLIDFPATLASGRDGSKELILLAVLTAVAAPVLRRTLEAILVYDHGFLPSEVTDTLEALRQSGRVIRSRFTFTSTDHSPVKFIHTNYALSVTKLSLRERKRYIGFLSDLYAEREIALNKFRLGDAAQIFVREMLEQSGQFTDITKTKNLGNVRIHKVHSLDLIVTEIATGIRYGISVKNENEWLHPSNTAIKDVVTKCKAHGVKPWLIAAFVTEKARATCKRNQIRLDGLNAQIAPSEYNPDVPKSLSGKRRMSSTLTKVAAVLGPEPFVLMPKRIRFPYYMQHIGRFTSIRPKGRG